MMKVTLKRGDVINGSVFPAGSVVDVDDETFARLLREEKIEKPAAPAVVPVLSEEKKAKGK